MSIIGYLVPSRVPHPAKHQQPNAQMDVPIRLEGPVLQGKTTLEQALAAGPAPANPSFSKALGSDTGQSPSHINGRALR